MADWQPIETAPKDGTWVLVRVYGQCIQARWCDDEGPCPPEWENGTLGLGFGSDPTHWQPLPEPPERNNG